MLSQQDVRARNIIVVNALEGRKFNMSLGNIVVSDTETEEVLTKLSCYKVFAVFVVGHFTITSQVLENFNKHGITLVILKPNFRPFFIYGGSAEANYLLRERQYKFKYNLDIATVLLKNKANNQVSLLKSLRSKTLLQQNAVKRCEELLAQMQPKIITSLSILMGIEGNIAKIYFSAIFDFEDWRGRRPRAKLDPYNVTLDIGYTFLFNFIECFVNLFGFDIYYGVCHQTWFKRKSLICDLVEPFRCIIDAQVRKSWNLRPFQHEHFTNSRGQFILLKEHSKTYTQVFFTELVEHKEIIFTYVRDYYRCFMGMKSVPHYPQFDYATRLINYADS